MFSQSGTRYAYSQNQLPLQNVQWVLWGATIRLFNTATSTTAQPTKLVLHDKIPVQYKNAHFFFSFEIYDITDKNKTLPTRLGQVPDMESQGIDLTKGYLAPEHPPPPGPGREQWTGWAEWDQHCRLVQQHTRLREIGELLAPTITYYYGLDATRLGSIKLPDFTFPKQPDLEDYSYDEVQEYLKEFYQKILAVALPQNHNQKHNVNHTRQTTLGRYLSLYQPLRVSNSTATIRLLEILPAATENESLSTRLFTADLDSESLTYEALSYTWGVKSSTDKKHFIFVNGHRQSVTPNLHSALSSLRHSSRNRTLWVDSICINQADVQERYQQVLLMARIYAGASKVLVYLGPSIPASDTLFRVLQSPVCDPATIEADDDDDYEGNSAFWKVCHDAGPQLVEGFIDICSRGWWNRVWVLQEYTLNNHDPVVYCGRLKVNNQVLSENFRRLYSWAQHRRRHPVLLDDCRHPACDRSYISATRNHELQLPLRAKENEQASGNTEEVDPKDIDPKARRSIIPDQGSSGREWSTWGRQVWKASMVMIRRSHCSPYSMSYSSTLGLQAQCTDPHDKVYGLRELMDPLFRSLFPPDYMIPLSTLFTRFAAYLIIVDRNVDIFWHFPHRLRHNDGHESQPQMSGNVRGIPSWVPDFTRPRMIREGEEAPLPHKEKTELWYSAAHIVDRVLFMEGFLLDEIIHVFPLPHNDHFLLLQQLWYVERSFGEPRYLRDEAVNNNPESGKPKDEFEDMMDRLAGVTIYPSIAWATEDTNRFTVDISIVDMINGLTNLGPLLLEPLESYMKKIPKVVDMIMEREQPGSHDLTSAGASSSPSRDDLIDEMESRFLKFTRLVASRATWKDLVGICTFDYENFRSQILHRLIMWSAQRVADLLGDRPGREYLKENLGPREEATRHAITHTPILYKEYIEAIEDCHDILEMRLREGFLIDLAARLHKTTADMVGLNGGTVLDSDDARGKDTTETPRRLVCMFPLPSSDERKKLKADQEIGSVIEEHTSSLDLPHDKPGHPFGEMSRWYSKPRQGIYDTHVYTMW